MIRRMASFASLFQLLHKDGTINMEKNQDQGESEPAVANLQEPDPGLIQGTSSESTDYQIDNVQDEPVVDHNRDLEPESMVIGSDSSETENVPENARVDESDESDDSDYDPLPPKRKKRPPPAPLRERIGGQRRVDESDESDDSDYDPLPPKRKKRPPPAPLRERIGGQRRGQRRPLRRKLFKQKRKPARTPEARKERDSQKYPLLDPCPPTCKRHCIQKINQERRKAIHSQFWEMDYNKRRDWIYTHINQEEPKRRVLHPASHMTREVSRYYHMPDSEGNDKMVCAVFFRHTLGYKHNKIITHTLASIKAEEIATPVDARGRHAPKHKLGNDALQTIKDHINSYHPSVSHYRREHAPLRRYLAPELTCKDMYKDFNTKHPGICKRERYRTTLKSMNISFAKLGEEECETCTEHKVHLETHQQDGNVAIRNCEECAAWEKHMERVGVARDWYRKDTKRDHPIDESVVSVDMQKIIMLPRMPGIKNCVFTRRLVQMHQTFAPLGGQSSSSDPVIGVIWDESMCGRNADDVASAYVRFMRHTKCRDKKKFVFYMDNCAGQNKNWTIYTAMIDEVNRPGGPDEIIFKYLEKGHTFMSADSFHHQVESGMKKAKNVYDGQDFKQIIDETGVAAQMKPTDFIMYENGLSQGNFTNRPLLSDVQEAKFTRGSTQLMWKPSMDDTTYKQGDFLKKKTAAKIMDKKKEGPTFPAKKHPRGISEDKKDGILSNLLKFMPTNRRQFWQDLPVAAASLDLIDH
ncbi:uncharacterized protein [Amphiura filiformis]|uniref:uncharacterized protein n=1 Tax=Amphiura filiformis TaxID=82378 RepID=UPI003B211426